MKSMQYTLQKGIADLMIAQLAPVHEQLAVLQTRTIDLNTLAEQVVYSEAWREATKERMLKIEEKGGNHIAYLEAQLEGLSLAKDLDAKQSETWPELGKPIAKKTS